MGQAPVIDGNSMSGDQAPVTDTTQSSARVLVGRFVGSMALISSIVTAPMTVFWWMSTGGVFARGCSELMTFFNMIGYWLELSAALTIALGVFALLLGAKKRGMTSLYVSIPILTLFVFASHGVC